MAAKWLRYRYIPIRWRDVKEGQTVFLDSYQGGDFPSANPVVCGPFTVEHKENRRLKNRQGRTFINVPEQLLICEEAK